MSFNGSGTFLINTAGQPVVSGTVISSTAFNALTADLATGLSTAITKDGQTTVTANIPMSTYKFTGLGVGSAATDSANLSQVQSTVTKLLTSVSGADTITAVGAPVVAAYAAGQMFYFVATGDNTGAVTLNIDALGAKAVTRDGSVALAAGDIKSGEVVVVVYDGTRFQVVSQLNSAGDARFANVSIASSLYVGGVSTFVGNAGFSANVSIASALSVGGVAAITGATTIGGNLTLNGGTANGVLYLNGSKVATSGTALAFDGTNFGVGTAGNAINHRSVIYFGGVNAVYQMIANGNTGLGATNGLRIGLTSAGVGELYSPTALITYIDNTERLRLDSSGNLGIGTSSPGSKLDVNGEVRIYPSSSPAQLRFGVSATEKGKLSVDTSSNMAFETAGSERMRLDSSGNLGLGVTPSAWSVVGPALQVLNATFYGYANQARITANAYFNGSDFKYIASAAACEYRQTGGQHQWFNAASGTAGNTISFTQAMTLDASGNLGVGITSPAAKIDLKQSTDNAFSGVRIERSATATQYSILSSAQGTTYLVGVDTANAGNNVLSFGNSVNGSTYNERARITSGGNLLVGTASETTIAGRNSRVNCVQSTNGEWAGGFVHSAATGTNAFGFAIRYSASSPNSSQNPFFYCEDSTALRAEIRSNGGLANYSANDVNLSDERTKKDIVPLGSMWDKFKTIEIVKFKYRDQTHDDDNIGVIAQQVESVAPEFVDADGWGETPEDGVPFKTVYTTDMYHAAIKALQEAMARIEQLEADVAALKGN
jgi:hypothetical protein